MAEQGFAVSQAESQSPVTPKFPKSRPIPEDLGRPGKRPRLLSPPRMTAAAALEEARQQRLSSPLTAPLASPNPQAAALGALMGINHNPTSPALQNAKLNPATTLSQPLSVIADNLQTSVDDGVSGQDSVSQISPVTSIGTVGSLMNPSGQVTAVASPQPIDPSAKSPGASVSPQDPSKSISYPQPFLTPQMDAARRGMSLPGSGRQNTRSPSTKKHKCPYCSTEFTRHHNLKSHLLTHSQEKPYVCSTCNNRFRRLHDLKRHTKLHTGERPHVCPKCNRKFARGDALARHNKGPGGCAGRRASMGSYNGDDDLEGDENVDGVVFGEPENMDDEDTVRGTPQIRRHPPSGDDSIDNSGNYRLPSTYPPIQGRPPGSFPPPGYPSNPPQSSNQQYHGSSSSSNPRGPGQVFNQNPMTESPQPILAPQRQTTGTIDTIGRNRSPSHTQYSYPQPGVSGSNSLSVPPHVPQLPPPHGLNPLDPRYTLPSQVGPTHPPTQPSGPPTHMSGSGPLSSHSNSSSHGFSGHGSGEGRRGAFPTNEERLWAVVKSLEQQLNSMRETIEGLRSEVGSLKQAFEQQPQR